jgi:hypothetical protein
VTTEGNGRFVVIGAGTMAIGIAYAAAVAAALVDSACRP